MEELERDSQQLDMVQEMIREVIQGKFGPELRDRSREVGFLLQDVVNLHRGAGSFAADGWVAHDFDIKKFLKDAAPLICPSTAGMKPVATGRTPGTSTPPALTNGRGSF